LAARSARAVPPRAIHVHDGDTFYVAGEAIRLRDIDTRELEQPVSAFDSHAVRRRDLMAERTGQHGRRDGVDITVARTTAEMTGTSDASTCARPIRKRGRRFMGMPPVAVAPLILLLLCAPVDIVSAQVPARVETPYTLIDAESRTLIQGGVEAPLRGNGPLTGYGYLFVTRPHFLHEDLYLRLIIPPGYFISELIRDHWPSRNSAIGFGLSGGLWAESQVEFRNGRFEKEESFSGHSAGGTLAYYLRGPMIGGLVPLGGQIRVNPRYVMYDRTDDTSRRFRLPENSAIYDVRVGVRLGGVPPELFPAAALELSLWHAVSYRDNAGRYGLPERPEKSEHFTQRTWTRLGGIYTISGTQASAFLNAGIAEDTDALSAFRLGGGLRLRTEFPLMLHGYNVEEIFARRFLLVNLAYRFPVWPGQDRVHLQLLADYARVDYLLGHRLPRTDLAGVGANLSVALTKRLTLAVGYGYGIDAPRRHGSGGHEIDTQFELKY
jgi:hypothetical protein